MLSTYILNAGAEIWGKKWRAAVLWYLKSGEERRFSEIKRELDGCSVKVLSEVLKELEQNYLVIRTQYPTIPVKVTYKLDSEFIPIFDSFKNYVDQVGEFLYNNHHKYKLPPEVLSELTRIHGSKSP